MARSSAEWVREKAFGVNSKGFWWRVDEQGNLTIRQGGGAPDMGAGACTVTLSPGKLEKLQDYMADGEWHALARTRDAQAKRGECQGIGPFLCEGLGWSGRQAKLAGALGAILSRAGVWEWNGKQHGTMFRLVSPCLERLTRYFGKRRGAQPRRRKGGKAARPPQIELAETFGARSRELRARFEACGSGGRHRFEKGLRRESALREFLRSCLPAPFGVSRGEVAAATGEVSHQVDVLVYDALRAPVLLGAEDSLLVAAESVYAAIEVKPKLRGREVKEAVANIASVKALPRSALLRPPGAGLAPEQNPPVFGAVFSFDSVDPLLVARQLRDHNAGLHPSLWVDYVCIHDRAVIYRYAGGPGPARWPGSDSAGPGPLACVAAGEHSLLVFYLALWQELNARTLLPPDLMFYSQGLRLPEPTLV